MKDIRFPRPYFLKTKENELEELKKICEEYEIATNDIFSYALASHTSWGLTDDGLMYISTSPLEKYGVDFNSLDDLVDYLESFISES